MTDQPTTRRGNPGVRCDVLGCDALVSEAYLPTHRRKKHAETTVGRRRFSSRSVAAEAAAATTTIPLPPKAPARRPAAIPSLPRPTAAEAAARAAAAPWAMAAINERLAASEREAEKLAAAVETTSIGRRPDRSAMQGIFDPTAVQTVGIPDRPRYRPSDRWTVLEGTDGSLWLAERIR